MLVNPKVKADVHVLERGSRLGRVASQLCHFGILSASDAEKTSVKKSLFPLYWLQECPRNFNSEGIKYISPESFRNIHAFAECLRITTQLDVYHVLSVINCLRPIGRQVLKGVFNNVSIL